LCFRHSDAPLRPVQKAGKIDPDFGIDFERIRWALISKKVSALRGRFQADN